MEPACQMTNEIKSPDSPQSNHFPSVLFPNCIGTSIRNNWTTDLHKLIWVRFTHFVQQSVALQISWWWWRHNNLGTNLLGDSCSLRCLQGTHRTEQCALGNAKQEIRGGCAIRVSSNYFYTRICIVRELMWHSGQIILWGKNSWHTYFILDPIRY